MSKRNFNNTNGERPMNQKTKDICQMIRFSTDCTFIISKGVIYNKNGNFKEQKEAYQRLKKNSDLIIDEEEADKNELMITIIQKQDHKGE